MIYHGVGLMGTEPTRMAIGTAHDLSTTYTVEPGVGDGWWPVDHGVSAALLRERVVAVSEDYD